MAKQRFGINDGYRGTVGTVIGYMWRGRWCLRARPRQVYNPRTPRQQANRTLFKQMVCLAGTMKKALREGLHRSSMELHMTECNLFVKRNRDCFALDGEERMTVDWARLMVSEGTLAAPQFEEPVVGEEGVVTFPFKPCGEDERASGDDAVYVYAYCPGAGEGRLSATTWRRNGEVTLTLPEEWQGMEVHVYGFAADFKGNASGTVYIGTLEPDAVLSRWHNNCRGNHVTNENILQSWQTRKSKTTSNSTSILTWPRAPMPISSSSVTRPPR